MWVIAPTLTPSGVPLLFLPSVSTRPGGGGTQFDRLCFGARLPPISPGRAGARAVFEEGMVFGRRPSSGLCIKSPGVNHGRDFLVAAEDDEEIANHRGFSLFVHFDDRFLR
jgi:hypothetical protein